MYRNSQYVGPLIPTGPIAFWRPQLRLCYEQSQVLDACLVQSVSFKAMDESSVSK